MIGIVFATRQEARPFLAMVAAVPIDDKVLPLYRLPAASHPGCLVAVSGMGKVAATLAAVHLVVAHGVEVLVNAGLCGRLSAEKTWGVGHLLRIDRSVEGDCDRFGRPEPPLGCDPGWFADLEAARLVTCDRPVFGATRRRELTAVADLADMEGAAVARVAHCYGIACAMLKGISDCADGTGRQDIARHLSSVSEKIARRLVGELTLHVTEESA